MPQVTIHFGQQRRTFHQGLRELQVREDRGPPGDTRGKHNDCLKLPHSFKGEGTTDSMWTKVNSFDGKLGALHMAKVHVFSDSVLCVGNSAISGVSGKW